MERLNKTIHYSKLLEIYKNLLTPTQIEMMEDYFLYDLSYSEIALNRQVSRSAVEDAIKKGMNKLDEYEEKLNLLNKKEMASKIINEMEKINRDQEIAKLLEMMKRSLD